MISFLLDTNIVSFLVRRSSPVLDRRMGLLPSSSLAPALRGACSSYTCGVSLEVRDSIVGLTLRTVYADLAAAQERAGEPLSQLDTMIAAHALAYDLTLVTNDQACRRIKDLRVEDWTQGPQLA